MSYILLHIPLRLQTTNAIAMHTPIENSKEVRVQHIWPFNNLGCYLWNWLYQWQKYMSKYFKIVCLYILVSYRTQHVRTSLFHSGNRMSIHSNLVHPTIPSTLHKSPNCEINEGKEGGLWGVLRDICIAHYMYWKPPSPYRSKHDIKECFDC